MTTRAENNPFPSILVVEQDKDALTEASPAAGQQRLVVDSTDHELYLVDSTNTATAVGGAGGFSDPMTTRGDIIIRNASNVTARLGRGTATYVLTSDGTDVAWAAPAAGGSTLAVVRKSVTPTVSTSPAYTAADSVGGLLTFSNAAASSGGSIIIAAATIIDLSQQMPVLDLMLFDRTFTNTSDNAKWDPTDGDLANFIGTVSFTTWQDNNDNSESTRTGISLPAKLNGTDLFGQLVTRSTPTFAGTSDITVILHIVQIS